MMFFNNKTDEGEALRKHSLYEKAATSVLLKLFISSNEWCHTTDAHEQNSIFKCKQHTCTLHDPWGPEKYDYTILSPCLRKSSSADWYVFVTDSRIQMPHKKRLFHIDIRNEMVTIYRVLFIKKTHLFNHKDSVHVIYTCYASSSPVSFSY